MLFYTDLGGRLYFLGINSVGFVLAVNATVIEQKVSPTFLLGLTCLLGVQVW